MNSWVGTVIITVAALLTGVALVLHGEDVASIGAILGVIGLFVDNRSRLGNQDAQLAKISDNTNGKLDKRIREGVTAGIEEYVASRAKDGEL